MMLESALTWAQKGFAVFPCVPLGKEPATTNGHKDATTDPAIIKQWWSQNSDYNIGVSPGHSGMFVLDVDPPRGEDTLAELELQHAMLPATLCFRSPRGGRHIWFRGRCPSSVGTDKRGLGPKLDTRGYGGYVLLPPSRVRYDNGLEAEYQCTDEREIANGPTWIAEAIHARQEHHDAANIELDKAPAVARARSLLQGYVSSGDVAIQGAGGDDRTYRLACEVINLGLSARKAWEMIRDIWNPHCVPEWDADELAVKVRNAAEYAQNDAGAWAVETGAETFSDFARNSGTDDRAGTEHPRASRYYPYELTDAEAFEPPAWLIDNLIPKNGTVQITGPKKSFKTFIALDLVLSVAAGVSSFAGPVQQGPVVYIAGENASAIALKHVSAWCMANDQEPALLPFRIVREMPHAVFPEEIAEFIGEVKRLDIQPAVVVIDTATRALRGLDENSAKDMGQFSAACEMVQRELACTVIVIRHTGKDAARGGRGSNVIEGDFDTILSVERQEDQQGRKTMFCTLTVEDQRNAAEREEPYAFEATLLGQSLIMRPISNVEHAQAVRAEDPFSRARIGAALTKLGAVGQERACKTHVLAAEITPPLQGDTPEQHEAAIARVSKALRKRAKTILAGFAAGEGSELVWFVALAETLAPESF